MMNNDRQIKISTGSSRKATTWMEQIMPWQDFVLKLSKPVQTNESFAEYKALTRQKQDDLKDVGGFVGGTLLDGRRRNENAGCRDLITLDADSIEPGGTQRIINIVDSLGCAYAIYSTRKHEGAAPRLRIIFPTDRSCSADEYEPLARKIAAYIDMNIFDPTTFEPVRLMYWPSISADSEFVFLYGDKPFLSADGMLAMYTDWRNVSEWPEVPGSARLRDKSAKKQGNPLEKTGVVGAFCKSFSIEEAMEQFIPGEYEASTDEGRFTYTEGSTVGGAVLYDDKFIYSHHATDPCSGKLCNAFDMVRLHLFNAEDADAKPDTPVTNLPSFKKMCEFAVGIEAVSQILLKERYETAVQDFSSISPSSEEDYSWMSELSINAQTGKPLNTIRNVEIILGHDPKITGHMYLDDFSKRVVIVSPLPWEVFEYPYKQRVWVDADDSGLRSYLEKVYMITGEKRVFDGFALYAETHKRNRLKDYLLSLQWDGVPRIDTLMIDYFGAEDSIYTREAIRKCLVAAVARVVYPGTKFDNMLILAGRQGTGKTTFFGMLGMEWYSESLSTFEGKDAAELLQGYWIIEAGELTGLNKTEMNTIKQFLSKREDVYRAPYGRRTEAYPRRCIIVGTTNDKEFLRDVTGNRRFWPIDSGAVIPVKSVWKNLPGEVNQIWAEAVCLMHAGEPLILSQEANVLAEEKQIEHRETSPKEGMIRNFLEQKISADWYTKPIDFRRDIMSGFGESLTAENGVSRDRVCVAEIYIECFRNLNIGGMKRQDSMEINNILRGLEGWEAANSNMKFGSAYGLQRAFKRKQTN